MDRIALRKKVLENRDLVIRWRRTFHRYPEKGLECERTAAVVAEQLRSLGWEVKTGVARTGVIGTLRGTRERPVVGLRVDMDALSLEEKTGRDFASERKGLMHACGHDGHTAMGLGVATVLTHFRETIPGTIKCIFQPGEEGPGGAPIMIDEGALEDPGVDFLLGCHIHPSLPSGTVGICYGTVTAGDYEFEMTLRGRGGHGARPHESNDPIIAAGHLITALQTIVSRRSDPLKPMVITLGEIHGGTGSNVIPDEVSLKGIVRYVASETKETALAGLKDILAGTQATFGMATHFRCLEEIPPMRLDDGAAARVEKAVLELLGEDGIVRIREVSMGADDFAYFTEKVPCGYLRFGCYDEEKGFVHVLHNARFDFDEAVLEQGTLTLSHLIYRLLEGYSED